jgi:uncharacterized membrane protein YqjE
MKERLIHNDEHPAAAFDEVAQPGSRGISRILQEIVSHVAEIIRSELQLARTEARQEITQVANAGIYLLFGIVFGLFALGFVLLGAVYALGSTMPVWLAAIIVGAASGTVAMIFLSVGRTKMKKSSLKADITNRSLQENATWMKKRTG